MRRGVVAALAALGVLSACDPPQERLKPALGAYVGVAQRRGSAGPFSPATGELDSLPLNGGALVWQLKLSSGLLPEPDMSVKVTAQSPSQIRLEWTPASFPAENLTVGADLCFKGQVTQFCLQDGEISLSIGASGVAPVEILLAAKSAPSEPHPNESPKAYTVAELRQHAADQSFATRLEFFKVLEARSTAESTYENLLPHVSVNSILNILSLNILNGLKTIGDFAPFLLPSRWQRAQATEWQARAETQAFVAMRLDAAATAEGLAFSCLREQAIQAELQKEQDSLNGLLDEIGEKERLGLLPLGSSDDLRAVQNALDEAVQANAKLLDSELSSLAGGVGFFSPSSVSGVLPSSDDPLPQNLGFTEDQAVALAVARAPELQQMSDLIDATHLSRDIRYFSFLDPSGDSSGGLGPGWTEYIAVGNDQIDEMQVRRDSTEAMVRQKIHDAFVTWTDAAAEGTSSATGAAIQDRRIDRMVENLRNGISQSLTDLAGAIQERSRQTVAGLSASAEARLAYANLRRWLISGAYLDIEGTAMPSPSPSPAPAAELP